MGSMGMAGKNSVSCRYFLVGQVPVKVSYREDGFRQPFRAEVPDQASGRLIIDNVYLGEIDDGGDVSDLSETQFMKRVEGLLGPLV